MKITIDNAEHYNWGNSCDGWHLLKTDSLSIIQERMPPGTFEGLHFHVKAQQFFYVLSGTATFEVEQETSKVRAGEGMHIEPGKKHTVTNNESGDLYFLVISEPKSHGDRVNV